MRGATAIRAHRGVTVLSRHFEPFSFSSFLLFFLLPPSSSSSSSFFCFLRETGSFDVALLKYSLVKM